MTKTYGPFRLVICRFSVIANAVVPMIGDKIGNSPLKDGELVEVKFPDGYIGEYIVHVRPDSVHGVVPTKARIADKVHGAHVQIDLIESSLEVRRVLKEGGP